MQSEVSALKTIYDHMMEIAREQLNPEWKNGEVIVLETYPGQYHYLAIHNFQDPAVRKPLEKELIEHLTSRKDTRVIRCLCTTNGRHPEIPSWHLRSNLIEIDPRNLKTEVFLWGGGNEIHVKPFSALLPPKKNGNESL